MSRSLLRAALIASIIPLGATAAIAQFNPFGSLFGDPPPQQRPPASVPGGRQQMTPPPRQAEPPGSYQPPGPYGPVQSQPLPPPQGANAAPPGARPPGAPPVQRTARPEPGTPSEDAGIEPPTPKVANKAALFSGLDKITGRIIKFDVSIGETVQFGALQLTPRVCYTRPATETSNTDAFVEVDEVTLQGEVRRIFTGWMFASSPGLHAVEHPIYDLWLTDCKSPVVAAAPEPPPTAAAPPPRAQPKQQPKRQPAQQPNVR